MIKNPERYPSYSIFTEDEIFHARSYNEIQRAWLETELAERVEMRLALRFDPTAAHEFVQQEAYLTGQMELLQQLLTPYQPSNTTQNQPE